MADDDIGPRVPKCLLRPPDEHWPEIRAEQNAFREQFAEHFGTAFCDGFWTGCSETGEIVGFQFTFGEEIKARAALPFDRMVMLIGQLQLVAEIAAERYRLARETQGVG